MIGRRKPYTTIGIRRLRCQRCKRRRAVHQWNCCANDNRWVPICIECDIALNRLALRFMKIPGAARLLARYARQARADA